MIKYQKYRRIKLLQRTFPVLIQYNNAISTTAACKTERIERTRPGMTCSLFSIKNTVKAYGIISAIGSNAYLSLQQPFEIRVKSLPIYASNNRVNTSQKSSISNCDRSVTVRQYLVGADIIKYY